MDKNVDNGINHFASTLAAPLLWRPDGCYLPPCLEALVHEGASYGEDDLRACLRCMALYYKGCGATPDDRIDQVLQGISDRSAYHLSPDEIAAINDQIMVGWREHTACDELLKSPTLAACCVKDDCKIHQDRSQTATGATGYSPVVSLGDKISLKSLALWHVERLLLEDPGNQMVVDASSREVYFWLNDGGHGAMLGLESQAFIDDIARRVLTDDRSAGNLMLSRNAYKELIPSIRAVGKMITQSRGLPYETEMGPRVREVEGAIWYDLGRKDWMGMKITPGKVTMAPLPIGFVRRGSLVAQVEPDPRSEPDDIFLLADFMNLPGESTMFALAWCVSAMISSFHSVPIPKTILWLSGPHGSAKTTMAEFILSLIDPDGDPLKNPPSDAKDLAAILKSYYTTILDNVSEVKKWLSDALCQVATGGSLTKRALYTDFETTTARFNSRIMITSLGIPRMESDLQERTLFLYPDPVDGVGRKSRVQVKRDFDRLKPLIFGGLLTTTAKVLEMLPEIYEESISWKEKPRMLDFAVIGEACIRVWGLPAGCFLDAYNLSLDSGSSDLVSDVPVASQLKIFMANRGGESWTGLVKTLLEELTDQAKGWKEYGDLPAWWPKSPTGLGRLLTKYSADLLREGYRIKDKHHTRNGETITISYEPVSHEPHANLTEENDISKLICETVRFVRFKKEKSNRNSITRVTEVSPNEPHEPHRGSKPVSGECEVRVRDSIAANLTEIESHTREREELFKTPVKCSGCGETTRYYKDIGLGVCYCPACLEEYLQEIEEGVDDD